MKLLVEAAADQPCRTVPLSKALMMQLVHTGREDVTSVWCQRVCEAINTQVRRPTPSPISDWARSATRHQLVVYLSVHTSNSRMLLIFDSRLPEGDCLHLGCGSWVVGCAAPRTLRIQAPHPCRKHSVKDPPGMLELKVLFVGVPLCQSGPHATICRTQRRPPTLSTCPRDTATVLSHQISPL